MSDVVIIGAGGHARVLHKLLQRRGETIAGYVAPEPAAAFELPYLGTDADLPRLAASRPLSAALGIGKVTATTHRLAVLDRLEACGITCPVLIAPTATVHDDVACGNGTVVLDGAIVVTGSTLGRRCIVNTGAIIDHDCQVGDDVHVAVGAVVCGGVRIGQHCMIGAGATIIQSISICDGCTIGAGATVTRDITEPGIWVGTPIRRVQ
jgi:sugar O-acyltransferase (sialic acid O-acetyltransferase NeuD family)